MLLTNRKLRFSIVFVFAMVFCISSAKAQAFFTNPFAPSYFQPKFGLNAGTFFNHEDFLFDFGLGLEELGYDFSATINGSFRPYYKKVFFEESDHLYYQVQEKVLQFTLDLEKRFYFLEFKNANKIGLYGILKFGYFFGSYKGLKKARNDSFTFTPGAGLSWQIGKNTRLSLGYLLFNQNPYAHPHTINFKLSLFFNNKDDVK